MTKRTQPSFVDLTGKKFGKLKVLKRDEDVVIKSGKKLVAWLCQCDCGNTCTVMSANLKSGNTKSCSCVADKIKQTKRDTPNSNAEDFIGKQFGVLTVEKEITPYRDSNGHKQRRFRCRCYCGKRKDTRIDELKNGIVVSCGCLSAGKLKLLMMLL